MSPRTEIDAPPQAVAKPAADRAPIAFVGGTGRSGTHVVAKLLAKTGRYAVIPMEVRFHVDEDGFPGLLSGAVSKEAFLRRLRGRWWKGFQTTRFRGLHRLLSRERFERAVEAFDRRFDSEPEAACAELFLDLLWPARRLEEESIEGIVEQSCDTVAQAKTLLRLFPQARFVHVVRDGRDASASRVAQGRWLIYPRTRRQGLEWWEHRIRRIDRGARAIPEGQLFEVELGELFIGERGRVQVRRLARFAGARADARADLPIWRFARRRMSSELANEARWRQGLSRRRQQAIDARYVDLLARLQRDGVSCAPRLLRAYERSRAAG
jgi:hypothetical protein